MIKIENDIIITSCYLFPERNNFLNVCRWFADKWLPRRFTFQKVFYICFTMLK